MNRRLLLFIVLAQSLFVRAQFFVGGSIGLGGEKVPGQEMSFTYKITPDFGYNINERWALGLALSFKKGNCIIGQGLYGQDVSSKAWGFQPYVRYNAININSLVFFLDGIFSYEYNNYYGDNILIGFCPGLMLKVHDKFILLSHIGFCGVEYYNSKSIYPKSTNFGLDFDSKIVSVGAYYLF